MPKRITFFTAGAVATASETAQIKEIREEIEANRPELFVQNGAVAIGPNDTKPEYVAGAIPEVFDELPVLPGYEFVEAEEEQEQD